MSIIIEKCSEYNVRIMKTPDFKNKTHGYNFSYPLMNSIEICNLFISGGTIEVSMIGSPKSIYSFDEEKKTLTIQQKNKEQKYIIDNPSEIGETMIAYFESNKDEILTKTLETNLKKSQSKIGNQNAVKPKQEIDICNDIKETGMNDHIENARNILKMKHIDDKTSNIIIKQLTNSVDCLKAYPADCFNAQNNRLLEDSYVNNIGVRLYQLCDYMQEYCHKSIGEYYYWIVSNNKLDLLDDTSKSILELMGYNPNLIYQDWRKKPDYVILTPPTKRYKD